MSLQNDFDDLGDLGKISQRWKNGTKDVKSQNSGSMIQKIHSIPKMEETSFESGVSQTQESCVGSESSAIIEGKNPWKDSKLEKENLKSVSNTEILAKKNFEKSRTRNHAPQIIDEDTEQFKIKLEHLLLVFKTEATSEFMQMKRSMLDDQKQTIQSETERYLQLYEEKTQEMQETKIQLANKVNENNINYERTVKMAELLGQFKTIAHQTKLKQTIFQAFKTNKVNREQKQFKKKLSTNLRKRSLSIFILGQWKLVHRIDIDNKKEKILQDLHRRDLDDLVSKFQKDNQLMEQRLKEATSGLDEANKLKQGIQENLKRAFMRGVCALNFEAMSVIGGQQVQGADQEALMNALPQLSNNSLTINTVSDSLQDNLSQASQTPGQTVQFYNQNRIETNDHKWRVAPLVGNTLPVQSQKENTQPQQQQNQLQKHYIQKEIQESNDLFAQTNQQRIQGQTQALQMSIQNLVQLDDGLLDKSTFEDDEGKVIKVNLNEPKRQIKSKDANEGKKSVTSNKSQIKQKGK